MYFRSRILCEKLSQYEKIIIYGTGDFAKAIYPQLVRHGLKKKIACFTRTQGSEPASIDGIPVINIKELHYNMEECVVLVAVSKLYVDEIKRILTEYGYPNIFFWWITGFITNSWKQIIVIWRHLKSIAHILQTGMLGSGKMAGTLKRWRKNF